MRRVVGPSTGRAVQAVAWAFLLLPLPGQELSPISAVTWGNGSAVVSWTTATASTSVVNYGEAPDTLPYRASSPGQTTNHAVTLGGLTAGVSYYYAVTSVDARGKDATVPSARHLPLNFLATSSVWDLSATPAVKTEDDPSPVELGMKFQSDVAGKVTGVRFYKGPKNRGTHAGHLWTSSGTLLASVTFKDESASGWQQATFATPVSISPHRTYVVSYCAPNGYYSSDENYFGSTVSTPPLRALGSEADLGNGLYRYGASEFPSQSWNARNYWVDVIFVPSVPVPALPIATSIWSQSVVPATVSTLDSTPVEVGLKFQSDVAGEVTGVRFYKGPGNIGIHTGRLWSVSGLLLATVNFTNETESGWQEARLASPVAIQAKTTYVVSYHTPRGHASADAGFLTTAGVYRPPLHALESAVADGNGVYINGAGGFPDQSEGGKNYWVDVVFRADTSNALGTPSTIVSTAVSKVTDMRGFTGVNSGNGTGHLSSRSVFASATASRPYRISGLVSGTAATVTLSGASSATTTVTANGTYLFSSLANGFYTVTPSQPGYTFSPASASVSVNGTNVGDVNFTGTGTISVPTYKISGTVTGASATLTLSGTASAMTTTAGNGTYEFAGLPNGQYTIGASQPGYTFTPATASVTVSGADVTAVNFTATASPLAVVLSWVASVTHSVSGYNVYRATVSGGPYTVVNSSLVAGTSYQDISVNTGKTYYYVTTAVDSANDESEHSNEAEAAVP